MASAISARRRPTGSSGPVTDVDRLKRFYTDQVGFNAVQQIVIPLGRRPHPRESPGNLYPLWTTGRNR